MPRSGSEEESEGGGGDAESGHSTPSKSGSPSGFLQSLKRMFRRATRPSEGGGSSCSTPAPQRPRPLPHDGASRTAHGGGGTVCRDARRVSQSFSTLLRPAARMENAALTNRLASTGLSPSRLLPASSVSSRATDSLPPSPLGTGRSCLAPAVPARRIAPGGGMDRHDVSPGPSVQGQGQPARPRSAVPPAFLQMLAGSRSVGGGERSRHAGSQQPHVQAAAAPTPASTPRAGADALGPPVLPQHMLRPAAAARAGLLHSSHLLSSSASADCNVVSERAESGGLLSFMPTDAAPRLQPAPSSTFYLPRLPFHRSATAGDLLAAESRAAGPPLLLPPAAAPPPPTQQPPPARAAASTKLLSLCPEVPAAMRRAVWCLDDYALEERLYKGAMSAVYRATCTRSGLPVALKVYFQEKVPENVVHMVMREIDVHSPLLHRNITKLYAAFAVRRGAGGRAGAPAGEGGGMGPGHGSEGSVWRLVGCVSVCVGCGHHTNAQAWARGRGRGH